MQHRQIHGDSSSSEGDLHPRRHPSRPRHTRSVSTPFPSLFSSKKRSIPAVDTADHDDSSSDYGLGRSSSHVKRQPPPPSAAARGHRKKSRSSPTIGGAGHDDSSSDYGLGISSSHIKGQPPPSSPAAARGHRNGLSVGGKDFVTGPCMTCGSLVRWPAELNTFKCTICVTINDLQPLGGDGRRADRQDGPAVFEEQPYSNGRPISLSHTKSLVEKGLRSFLISALGKQRTGSSTARHGFPAAPSYLSPYPTRAPAQPTATPLTLRPKISLGFEPRPAPGMPKSSGQHRREPSWTNAYSTSFPERPAPFHEAPRGFDSRQSHPPPSPGEEAAWIFKPLEDYITACFTSFHCLNSSFLTPRAHHYTAGHGADTRPRRPSQHVEPRREPQSTSYPVPYLDPKLLLLGDFAENGTWWTGQEQVVPSRTPSNRSQNSQSIVSSGSPHINWEELDEWYITVVEAARPWFDVYEDLVAEDQAFAASEMALQEIEAQILIAQENAQSTLLKACERILKRPGRPIAEPQELRFLLITMANPLLHAWYKPYAGKFPRLDSAVPTPNGASPRGSGPTSGRHSVIIKRTVGLMSNAPAECHNHLIAWFARYQESRFIQTKDLVAGFLVYRLIRQREKKFDVKFDGTSALVPTMQPGRSPASLLPALRPTQRSNKKNQENTMVVYQEDWQIKAAAQILGLLFAANNTDPAHRGPANRPDSPGNRHRELVHAPGQILATSDFYMTLLDDSDLVADFEAWERKQGRFSFCQYPFLLSIGAKIQILEHDARRQMESKARNAFIDSIMTNRVVQQFLVLNIRRDCLVEDSLRAVREVIGGGGEEIKKGLRINFRGEEGVDAGGLRKEWFLLLVRELFNPDHGMFLYDEDSHCCYFNPSSLEPSEQFYLVGVVLGLAIYNSTILDVALPPFAFRKLLSAAPLPTAPTSSASTATSSASSHPRPQMTYTLDDLAQYRPRLARGLRQLLAYEGDDVESAFALDFSIDTERYGAFERVLLCPAGDRRPVTSANRREYVDAYVRYVLDTAVTRQFEPFKRGFFTVCGGSGGSSALGLFRPEEIELLVCGSGSGGGRPVDVAALRAGARYEGWDRHGGGGDGRLERGEDPAEREDTVRWFWEAFESAEPADQRRLLAFVTGSDRVPAMGAASLGIRVACLGEECGRFPTARTCFNLLGLWRWSEGKGGRERFEEVLWRAVRESEGFGLR